MSSANQRWQNVATDVSDEKRVESVRVSETVVVLLKRATCALTRVSMPHWDECLQG